MPSGDGKRGAGEENGMRRLRGQDPGVGPRKGEDVPAGKEKIGPP